jgi:PAS domain S-box-containing protein
MRNPLSPQDLERRILGVREMKKAFDGAETHIVITDPDANVLYANKAAERVTGFSHEEIIGKNPGDLWGGQMPKSFWAGVWKTIKEDKKPFRGEVRNKGKDGREFWQELYIMPILDDNGSVRFFVGFEPEAGEQKAQDAAQKDFTSVIGHQLQSPLTGIKWGLELLADSVPLKPEDRTLLETVSASNEKLIRFVSDLLLLSHLSGPAASFAREPTDIAALLADIALQHRKRFPKVRFVADRISPCTLSVSKMLAEHVFGDVIRNAAEYCGAKDGTVRVELAEDKGAFTFTCEDNGIGIPRADQEKIFSRAFRAGNAAGVKSYGNGLELFIVKTITSLLGWQISFQSEEGKGTTFVVRMPKDAA